MNGYNKQRHRFCVVPCQTNRIIETMTDNINNKDLGTDDGDDSLSENDINGIADELFNREFPHHSGRNAFSDDEILNVIENGATHKRSVAYLKKLSSLKLRTRLRMSMDGGFASYGNAVSGRKTFIALLQQRPAKSLRVCAAACIAVMLVLLCGKFVFDSVHERMLMASAGQRYSCVKDTTLNLSDGTKVALQHGTQLRADKNFGGNARRVSIDGQGFMDVSHDTKRPYTVDMPGKLTFTVLGTAFNVNAASDCPIKEITVARGCVLVKNSGNGTVYGKFRRGERLTYNSETGQVTRSRVPVSEVATWMTPSRFVLHGADVNEFRQKMFDVFGVYVIIRDQAIPSDAEIFCDVSPETPDLQTVLSQVCLAYGVQYMSKGRKIFIYR